MSSSEQSDSDGAFQTALKKIFHSQIVLNDITEDSMSLPPGTLNRFEAEMNYVLPHIDGSCCLETSMHILRAFHAGRRKGDDLTLKDSVAVFGARNLVLTLACEGDFKKEMDVLFTSFVLKLQHETIVTRGSVKNPYADLLDCWKACAGGVNSFNLTTLRTGSCDCPGLVHPPERRSFIPVRLSSLSGELYTITDVLGNFFKEHTGVCSTCGGSNFWQHVLVDRLPPYLLVEWPSDGQDVMPVAAKLGTLSFRYRGIDGKDRMGTYEKAKAYIMNDGNHTYPVMCLRKDLFATKDTLDCKELITAETLEDVVASRNFPSPSSVRAVLLQRSWK